MSWKRDARRMHPRYYPSSEASAFRVNQRCYIRKEHDCGKVFGASKSCFIACPTDDELQPTLELISEKLTKHGVEPIVAVRERAYGQDIFCTKICGKIIESRFCLVILDDTIIQERGIPNPNVYYEYGLMTSLRKHIIPLQKSNMKLAFNIQSYDTIKYTPSNVAAELERAIRDAIRLTDASADQTELHDVSDKLILRRLELAGFILKDYNWFLNDVIEDTLFKGFGNDDEPSYLYLGKVDSDDDARTYLEDLDVVLFRTRKKYDELNKKISEYEAKLEEVRKESSDRATRYLATYGLQKMEEELPGLRRKIESMKRVYVAFLVDPSLKLSVLKKKVERSVSANPIFTAVFSESGRIRIGEKDIELTASGT